MTLNLTARTALENYELYKKVPEFSHVPEVWRGINKNQAYFNGGSPNANSWEIKHRLCKKYQRYLHDHNETIGHEKRLELTTQQLAKTTEDTASRIEAIQIHHNLAQSRLNARKSNRIAIQLDSKQTTENPDEFTSLREQLPPSNYTSQSQPPNENRSFLFQSPNPKPYSFHRPQVLSGRANAAWNQLNNQSPKQLNFSINERIIEKDEAAHELITRRIEKQIEFEELRSDLVAQNALKIRKSFIEKCHANYEFESKTIEKRSSPKSFQTATPSRNNSSTTATTPSTTTPTKSTAIILLADCSQRSIRMRAQRASSLRSSNDPEQQKYLQQKAQHDYEEFLRQQETTSIHNELKWANDLAVYSLKELPKPSTTQQIPSTNPIIITKAHFAQSENQQNNKLNQDVLSNFISTENQQNKRITSQSESSVVPDEINLSLNLSRPTGVSPSPRKKRVLITHTPSIQPKRSESQATATADPDPFEADSPQLDLKVTEEQLSRRRRVNFSDFGSNSSFKVIKFNQTDEQIEVNNNNNNNNNNSKIHIDVSNTTTAFPEILENDDTLRSSKNTRRRLLLAQSETFDANNNQAFDEFPKQRNTNSYNPFLEESNYKTQLINEQLLQSQSEMPSPKSTRELRFKFVKQSTHPVSDRIEYLSSPKAKIQSALTPKENSMREEFRGLLCSEANRIASIHTTNPFVDVMSNRSRVFRETINSNLTTTKSNTPSRLQQSQVTDSRQFLGTSTEKSPKKTSVISPQKQSTTSKSSNNNISQEQHKIAITRAISPKPYLPEIDSTDLSISKRVRQNQNIELKQKQKQPNSEQNTNDKEKELEELERFESSYSRTEGKQPLCFPSQKLVEFHSLQEHYDNRIKVKKLAFDTRNTSKTTKMLNLSLSPSPSKLQQEQQNYSLLIQPTLSQQPSATLQNLTTTTPKRLSTLTFS